MRERLVNRDLNPRLRYLPDKFQGFPDHQRVAVTEVVQAFDDGAKVVVVDAPTGSGKTVIAEAVRLMLGVDGAYICHSKTLQDQFVREFDYAGVLYGRANYTPIHPVMDATCDDCQPQQCALCPTRDACPYQLAKMDAIRAPVAVINSALWLSATQTPNHWLTRRGLTVFDEADTLENVLMSQAEISISPGLQKRYSIPPPDKMTVADSYGDWAQLAVERLRRARGLRNDPGDIKAARQKRRLTSLIQNIELLQSDLKEGRPWVYTGGAGSERRTGEYISFKPVTVESLGERRIWRHSPRFLLMSGTVVSAGMMLRALGHTSAYAEVKVPSQFKPSSRQVVVRPAQDMTTNGQQTGLTPALTALGRILDDHRRDRILVHTVSYRLARQIETGLLGRAGRPVYTYADPAGRAAALQKYLQGERAVLVAASLDRGVDLYDDRCRAQVIMKVPFLSLGDKQTSTRLHSDGGKVWYNVEVARTIMQMVGRGVRHTDDWCVTYILDAHFLKWRRAWGHLFPDWFNRAIRVET